MAGEGAAAGGGGGWHQGPEGPGDAGLGPPGPPGPGSDWAGLPEDLLVKVADTLVAQTVAGWAARLKRHDPGWWTEERIEKQMGKWKRDGKGLFVFAMVCRGWRKAQLKVGGPLRTRVWSDVLLPRSVALVKWALAEGCPREDEYGITMAEVAAARGHLELARDLVQLLRTQKVQNNN